MVVKKEDVKLNICKIIFKSGNFGQVQSNTSGLMGEWSKSGFKDCLQHFKKTDIDLDIQIYWMKNTNF